MAINSLVLSSTGLYLTVHFTCSDQWCFNIKPTAVPAKPQQFKMCFLFYFITRLLSISTSWKIKSRIINRYEQVFVRSQTIIVKPRWTSTYMLCIPVVSVCGPIWVYQITRPRGNKSRVMTAVYAHRASARGHFPLPRRGLIIPGHVISPDADPV